MKLASGHSKQMYIHKNLLFTDYWTGINKDIVQKYDFVQRDY